MKICIRCTNMLFYKTLVEVIVIFIVTLVTLGLELDLL